MRLRGEFPLFLVTLSIFRFIIASFLVLSGNELTIRAKH
jgi:hypothetical protein